MNSQFLYSKKIYIQVKRYGYYSQSKVLARRRAYRRFSTLK